LSRSEAPPLRVYDIRNVIDVLADEGSVLQIRRDFGVGIVTAFIRIEGQPFGLIANNPNHLGGAIDAPAGDKAARFMQLCDAFDIPIVSLCDTPGFMVGPEAAKTAIVRHVARMFVTGASLTVPLFGVVLRKGYGLGGAIHDRRRFSCFLLHGGMADRRVRRHGPTASGPASMPGRMSRGS
jgi:acetyl-CoA carboxylase carboxyltransferase component